MTDRTTRRQALALLAEEARRDLERLQARLTAYRQAMGLPPAPGDTAAAR